MEVRTFMSEYYNYYSEENFIDVDPSDPSTIPKFIDELPIPSVLKPLETGEGLAYYEVTMDRAYHNFHKYFPRTLIWGYNGLYPGPTIETPRDQSVLVKWINNLPQNHFLPVDKTLHGTIDTPEVRTVVHLHGANVASDSDGHPDAWFTRGYVYKGSHFSTKVYKYTNHQHAALLWYHDHAIGITRLNVYAGLAGLYIIRDTLEQRLQLPCGKYEIPLVIQDKTFNKDGSLFYPSEPPFPVSVQPSVVPGFTGETIVVNGKVWPHLKVEPRKYRFRLLNASNSRAYTLALSNNEVFYQIGTDGGLMEKPVELTALNLLPAERADIIIDFSRFYHQNITLLNTADTNENTSQVLQFKVISPLKSKDNSKLPDFMYPMMHLEERLAVRNRILPLNVNTDMYGRPMFLLDNKMWHDPVTEKPEIDTIEIWSIVNTGLFPHPVHLHLVQFQILDRRPFDVVHYRETGEIIYTGQAVKPADNEMGWKDIVRVTPGEVTRIISQFKDFTGDYVWHCHILEHEDYDMMRPMKVIP